MRVSDSFRYDLFKNTISTLKTQLAKKEEQIASSRKILAPSDDPVGTASYIRLLAQKDNNSQYIQNLQTLATLGGTYETAANSTTDLLTTAKELATTMASDTQDAETRATAARQVETLIEQLVTVGNTKVGSTYVFGGKKSGAVPFTIDKATYAVTFNGTSDVSSISIGSGQTEKLGISGETFFGTQAGSDDNMFQVLKDFRDALDANDTTAIQSSLDAIDKAVDLNTQDLSYVGTYTAKIESVTNTLTNTNTNLTTTMAGIMDVDTVQAYSDYTTLTTTYEAVLTVLSKMQSLNILNYLK